jgi:glucose/arabinose dehydrogenase
MEIAMRASMVFCSLLIAACAGISKLPPGADVGPDPVIAPPQRSLIPTTNVAPAIGWPAGGRPVAAAGLAVHAFAEGLDHPRTLHVLPNGDVLVAETNAPERPDEGKSIKGFFMKIFMKIAGAGVKSANRITLLRDTDGDGVAETRSAFLEGLNAPFGMALVGNAIYVANTDGVMRFPYAPGELRITQPGRMLAALPAGTMNHHWTKSLVASRDGSKLYAGVGSNSNVAENGMAVEEGRAAVWEIDVATGATRVLATGIRNAAGLAIEPASGKLWAVVNERDELGNDLVPDYLTSVADGGFYGWPYSYYGSHVDTRVTPPRPELVAKALKPDYALGSHVAPLGLAFMDGAGWPAPFAAGAVVGQHGSWNRRPPNGYNVVWVPFNAGRPSGKPVEVLSGFLSPDRKAYGRPVGVAMDRRGALLVADDVGNVIWRVSATR